ncbi:matrixin family metalloprotease [Thioalkalivibrio sp.]|uniref:matrixin family metalloprotease n=1 Tax=Thioalkalivibrio sp. TaxID=2093813 RepID=UPI003975410C
MRSVTHAHMPMLAFILAGFLPSVFPLPAHAGEDGYRLLELDGYKVKWGDRRLGVGARVSYAFAGEPLRFDDARNCRDLAPIEALLGENLSMETLARETAAAFRVWERAAGLSFHEVADARDADIVLGAQGQPRGRAFANVSYAPDPEEGVRSIERALVCLNPDHRWKVGFDGNEDVYDIRHTLIHEIGHAIGLDHPGPSGQVMAFRYTEAFNDLQPGDLRGVQRLYGPAANDHGPANGFDTHLAERSTEAYRANHLIANSAMSMTEDEETGSNRDLIIDQDGRNVPAIGAAGIHGIADR